jgi:hypothetical protein
MCHSLLDEGKLHWRKYVAFERRLLTGWGGWVGLIALRARIQRFDAEYAEMQRRKEDYWVICHETPPSLVIGLSAFSYQLKKE